MDLQKIAWYSKIIFRNFLKFYLECKAKLAGKVFTCRVLNGTANYNLAINSDMTISCNCQDFDGAGRLGDFSKNSLEEILADAKAQKFRITLAEGRLPILACARCLELDMVTQNQAELNMNGWHVPDKHILVENTILCGCSCLSCARPEVMAQRKKMSLTLDDISRIASEIKKHDIKTVSYYNLGDPFMAPNVFHELSIIRKSNPHINILTSTNGLYLNTEEKFEAALLLDRIGVSIDGINTPMVRKYQRNGNFERSFGNLCNLVKYRNSKNLKKPKIVWNYILFNWNDRPEYIKSAIKLATECGIDELLLCHTKTPFWGTSWRWYTSSFYRNLNKNLDSQFLTIPLTACEQGN
ncbi:MAG: radical SAM protein [Candidatus Riflebacteria bacterium]|nr:radical SAM protein [Candidatus Riflebacteria bacterium]